ncbi:right-handed parallel beta-helix repeat-containing protein [Nonomuraea sp. AD125B]|uniref:right-handed parallel beta-helix repeat-containing protein n=1 Tax=Nonomuraea sp. AD125B TaxID=3242897 RepID=UPI003528CEB9
MFSKTLLACGLGGIALACALPTPASALDSNYKGETTVACGQVITKSIKLANDLHNCTGNGLVVGAANITIDLNGHTIDGTGMQPFSGIRNAQVGSRPGYSGVTIKNGAVTGFASGVTLGNGANRNVVQYINAIANGTGILLTGPSRGTLLYRNSVVNNAGDGILVNSAATGTRIDNNDANGNGNGTSPRQDGIEVDATDKDTVIKNNRARNNGDYGIRAAVASSDGHGNHASGNDAHGPNNQCFNIRCAP